MRQEIGTRRFAVEEYHRTAQAGILGEDDRVELVGGRPVEMAPIGTRRPACVVPLNHLLVEASAGRWFVSVRDPVRLSGRDEPEPGLILLRARPVSGAEAPPGFGDVLLVVEVYAGSEEAAGSYRVSRSFGPGERVVCETVAGLSIPGDEVPG